MQCIYALRTGNELPFPVRSLASTAPKPSDKKPIGPIQPAQLLQRQFDFTLSLFVYQIWFLTEVARYAETDARNRASNHLPTAADLSVAVKIAGNELLWRILESPLYKAGVEQYKPQLIDSQDQIKAIYTQLTQSTEYAVYNTAEGRNRKSEKEIMEFIYNDLMLANEDWVGFVEEHFSNWDDDAEMLQLLVLHYLQKPGVVSLQEMIGAEKFTFAESLLTTTEEKLDQLNALINPKLRNWDPERLAHLDVILLQMGVCELLYFETIPPNVTINEYIDIAKAYSTHQSGQFVNGILDNIRKDLENENRLQKVAYKK